MPLTLEPRDACPAADAALERKRRPSAVVSSYTCRSQPPAGDALQQGPRNRRCPQDRPACVASPEARARMLELRCAQAARLPLKRCYFDPVTPALCR